MFRFIAIRLLQFPLILGVIYLLTFALAWLAPGSPFDLASLAVALVGISLPSFVTAGVLLLVFAVQLPWFPIGGWRNPYELFLPAVALSLLPMAYIARLTRVSMIDTLGSDYVRT